MPRRASVTLPTVARKVSLHCCRNVVHPPRSPTSNIAGRTTTASSPMAETSAQTTHRARTSKKNAKRTKNMRMLSRSRSSQLASSGVPSAAEVSYDELMAAPGVAPR
jgi:hypothetical protein